MPSPSPLQAALLELASNITAVQGDANATAGAWLVDDPHASMPGAVVAAVRHYAVEVARITKSFRYSDQYLKPLDPLGFTVKNTRVSGRGRGGAKPSSKLMRRAHGSFCGRRVGGWARVF